MESTDNNIGRRERGKHRRACQPCNRRKVRCNRELVQPCSNCRRRQQPELCELGSESLSRARPHHAKAHRASVSKSQSDREALSPTRLSSQPPVTTLQSTPAAWSHGKSGERAGTRDHTPVQLHIGSPSIANFIQEQAGRTGYTLTGSLSSILGLQNQGAGYPFLVLGPSETRWDELEPILPLPFEIHRFKALLFMGQS